MTEIFPTDFQKELLDHYFDLSFIIKDLTLNYIHDYSTAYGRLPKTKEMLTQLKNMRDTKPALFDLPFQCASFTVRLTFWLYKAGRELPKCIMFRVKNVIKDEDYITLPRVGKVKYLDDVYIGDSSGLIFIAKKEFYWFQYLVYGGYGSIYAHIEKLEG